MKNNIEATNFITILLSTFCFITLSFIDAIGDSRLSDYGILIIYVILTLSIAFYYRNFNNKVIKELYNYKLNDSEKDYLEFSTRITKLSLILLIYLYFMILTAEIPFKGSLHISKFLIIVTLFFTVLKTTLTASKIDKIYYKYR